jgi:hypothetical protein
MPHLTPRLSVKQVEAMWGEAGKTVAVANPSPHTIRDYYDEDWAGEEASCKNCGSPVSKKYGEDNEWTHDGASVECNPDHL